jgi:predicted PurR-regulated permease PerM
MAMSVDDYPGLCGRAHGHPAVVFDYSPLCTLAPRQADWGLLQSRLFLQGESYVYRRHPRDNHTHRSHRLGCAQGVNDLAPSCEHANSTMLDHAATRAPITSGKIIIWGALGFLLYIAHAAFIPIVLALLFALVLSGPVEALHKLRIPRSVSASLILMLVLAAMAGGVDLMWKPAREWFAKAPQTMTIIKQKVSPVARFMNHLDDLRNNAANLGTQNRTTPKTEPAAGVSGESARVWIFGATTGAIAGVLTFVIVTLFLLAGGPPMLARMTAAFVDNLNASHVLHMIEAVRAEVGRFYVTTTLINMGFGVAIAVAMMAWGMPTPYLWGALAAGLNYIPYAGSVTTLIVLTLVAVVSFNTLGHVLGVSGTYVLLAVIEGQVMQPMLVGRRLELNPLLVFLGLWFGGLFWGDCRHHPRDPSAGCAKSHCRERHKR